MPASCVERVGRRVSSICLDAVIFTSVINSIYYSKFESAVRTTVECTLQM